MKINLLISSLFILSTNCYSADWELFPYKQKSFNLTQRYSATDTSLQVFVMDSVKIIGLETHQYFRRNVFQSFADSCNIDSLIRTFHLYDTHSNYIDSLIERNDTIFYDSHYSTTDFYFLPNAIIGQSWTVTSTDAQNDYSDITITCESVSIESFFGITDSVKTFSMTANGSSINQVPVDSFVIRLSKFHGLLEYVPFESLMHHPPNSDFISIKVIGYNNPVSRGGYNPPEFSDYFHLNAGDILFWEHHVDPMWIHMIEFKEYYRDSITDVLNTPDSVIYTFNREKKDTDNIITSHPGQIKKFFKKGFEHILNTVPDYVGLGNNVFSYHLDPSISVWTFVDFKISINNADTLILFSAGGGENYIDTDYCGTSWVTDISVSFEANEIAGITKYCFDMPGSDCTTLTGYRISGQQNGGISLSANEIYDNRLATINIYPNPSDEIIYLDNNLYDNSEFRIINNTGQCVSTGMFNGKTINIQSISDGLYFLEINSAKGNLRGRFIKN